MRSLLWHQFSRRIKRHFGPTAKQVAVRPQLPWYWNAILVGALILLGYFVGYLQFAAGDLNNLAERLDTVSRENQELQAKIVHSERQLQVERAAQTNLAKELAALQEEDMKVKEDLEFYKNILKDTAGVGELKLHSFKLAKGQAANQYNYNIMLMQSGKHERVVQGQLKLNLTGMRAGQPVTLPVGGVPGVPGIKINFKYYQRVEGSFTVPVDVTGHTLEASFVALGATQPSITRKIDLPV